MGAQTECCLHVCMYTCIQLCKNTIMQGYKRGKQRGKQHARKATETSGHDQNDGERATESSLQSPDGNERRHLHLHAIKQANIYSIMLYSTIKHRAHEQHERNNPSTHHPGKRESEHMPLLSIPCLRFILESARSYSPPSFHLFSDSRIRGIIVLR